MTGQDRSPTRGAVLIGVGSAALLLLASLAFYLTSGDAAAASDTTSSSSAHTPTSVYQSFPGCRVDVHSQGVGERPPHDVAV